MRFLPFAIAPALLAACVVAGALDVERVDAAEKASPKSRTNTASDPRLMAEFKATDTNKDGKLSRAEIDVRVKRMAAGSKQFTPAIAKGLTDRYFATADANHDGSISPAEWQGFTRAIAARYDTNGDGVVSVAEREAARRATLAEAKGATPPGR